jgi:hypothetical protein
MNGVFEIGCLRDIPEPGRSASVLRAGVDLDIATEKAALEQVREVVPGTGDAIVVDLSGVFVGACGVGLVPSTTRCPRRPPPSARSAPPATGTARSSAPPEAACSGTAVRTPVSGRGRASRARSGDRTMAVDADAPSSGAAPPTMTSHRMGPNRTSGVDRRSWCPLPRRCTGGSGREHRPRDAGRQSASRVCGGASGHRRGAAPGHPCLRGPVRSGRQRADGRGPAEWRAVRDGSRSLCGHLRTESREVIAGHGVRAVRGVPVRLGAVPVGSLDVYRARPHVWEDSERAALARYSEVVEVARGLLEAAPSHGRGRPRC